MDGSLFNYKFLGESDYLFPNMENGKTYTLRVVTNTENGNPEIIYPFYCPYESWKTFYLNWRPVLPK
jgi:hypothetical protein